MEGIEDWGAGAAPRQLGTMGGRAGWAERLIMSPTGPSLLSPAPRLVVQPRLTPDQSLTLPVATASWCRSSIASK